MGESSPGVTAECPAPVPSLPAGWYVDPWRLAPGRWWDGSGWTGETTGWRRRILWPPISSDGRYRYAEFARSEGAPSVADLQRRWPAQSRHAVRWWGPQNSLRIWVLVVIVGLALLGSAMGVLLAWVATLRLLLLRLMVNPVDRTSLVFCRQDVVGVSGTVTPRWEAALSPLSGTDCVWWEAVLDSRTRRGRRWKRCWHVTALGTDFNLAGAGGQLWVHVASARKQRRSTTELVRREFEQDGRRYRVVERGLRVGAEMLAAGLVVEGAQGEMVLSDDRLALSRPTMGISSALTLLPPEVLARRRTELTLAPIVTAVIGVLIAVAAFWPGVPHAYKLEERSLWELWDPSGLFFVIMGLALALLGLKRLNDARVRAVRVQLASSFNEVCVLANHCWRKLMDLEDRVAVHPSTQWPGPLFGVFVPDVPDAVQVSEARERIEDIGARRRVVQHTLQQGADPPDAATDALVEQFESDRRLLEQAIGCYDATVAEANAVVRRGGSLARRLEAASPGVPPSLGSSSISSTGSSAGTP